MTISPLGPGSSQGCTNRDIASDPNRLRRHGAQARNQPRLLGDRPAGRRGGRAGPDGRGDGFDSVWVAESYGSDVVSVLGWLAPQTETIKLGAAIMQVPARPPAAAAMAGATLDTLSGGRFIFGFGPSGPQVSEGWYGVPYAKPWGRTREYIEVVREIIAREGPLEHQGDALPAADRRRHRPGQGAEAQLPSDPQRDPGLRRRDRPQVGRDGGRDLRRLDPDLLQPRRLRGDLGRAPRRPGSRRAAAAAPTSRSAPRSRSRSTATSRSRATSSGPACCSTSAAWAAARPTSTSTSPAASASRRRRCEVQSLFLDGKRDEAFKAIPDELVDATSLVGTEAEVTERIERFTAVGIDRLICSPVHLDAGRAHAHGRAARGDRRGAGATPERSGPCRDERGAGYNRPMPDLKPGAVFAGHRIEGIAGRGGMGTVYRATHLALDHVVALKVIAADLAADDAFRERFRSESRIAVSLRHPNVVPIHHAGEEDGLLFVTMDLIDGPDLRRMLIADGTLDARAGDRDRRAGRLGARRRPFARPRPPRHQARQHPGRARLRRSRLPDRLRPRQALRSGDARPAPDPHRRVRRHARLRRPRADPRRPGRRPHRRLRARLRAVRGDRRTALRSPTGRRTSPRSTPTSRTSRLAPGRGRGGGRARRGDRPGARQGARATATPRPATSPAPPRPRSRARRCCARPSAASPPARPRRRPESRDARGADRRHGRVRGRAGAPGN